MFESTIMFVVKSYIDNFQYGDVAESLASVQRLLTDLFFIFLIIPHQNKR